MVPASLSTLLNVPFSSPGTLFKISIFKVLIDVSSLALSTLFGLGPVNAVAITFPALFLYVTVS